MELILHRIPANTSYRELYVFAQNGARSWWPFAPLPEISKCEIIKIKDEKSGSVEYHGLVIFRDTKVAERALRRLNGRKLNGKKILVKEYSFRSPGDHRLRDDKFRNEPPPERRRNRLKIHVLGEKRSVEAHKDSVHHHSG